ncbi:hypothetical protein P43SY_008399 [Pythium insidiosum]|uniref:Uncharacterized protein n=1 Tax=Pythium insidiosum TaxID=114742 RepID=A0AAD5LGR3_PYTIN|nr:hypothetical protein P43SY_008399 [Pythium insidiosum]
MRSWAVAAFALAACSRGAWSLDPPVPPDGVEPPPDPVASTGSATGGAAPQDGSGSGVVTEGNVAVEAPPRVRVDFGSIGSSSGRSWRPIPDLSGGSLDWDDSGSAPGPVIVDPDLDGSVRVPPRRHVHVFDIGQGFNVAARDGPVEPGHCDYEFCVHLTFASDFGVFTPFDAFVLDRVETAQEVGSSSVQFKGPMPMILGRLWEPYLTQFVGLIGERDSARWRESRTTTWTLFPVGNETTNVLDVTLSLKQLFTLLPNYVEETFSRDPSMLDGPFYSPDLTDQLIVRLIGQVASPFAGTSGVLPLRVRATGSKLIDVSAETSLLPASSQGITGGNELAVRVRLSRRRYGPLMSWYPAQPSPECVAVDEQLPSDSFGRCFEHAAMANGMGAMEQLTESLLKPTATRRELDVTRLAMQCFAEIRAGKWLDAAENRTLDGSGEGGESHARRLSGSSFGADQGDAWSPEVRLARIVEALSTTDAALHAYASSSCPLAGGGALSDGRMVVLEHQPALTSIEFPTPKYSFYLLLGVDAAKNTTVTTAVFDDKTPADEIAAAIESAMPDHELLNVVVDVRRFDNVAAIASIKAENARRWAVYRNASSWGGVGNSDSSGSGLDGPRPPKLLDVPTPRWTIEIQARNITVAPRFLDVFTPVENVTHEDRDARLAFAAVPLDLHKFEYKPPPRDVNLEWDGDGDGSTPGPGPNPDPRPDTDPKPPVDDPLLLRLPLSFPRPGAQGEGACAACFDEYAACVKDEDCTFGVQTFLAAALAPERCPPEAAVQPPTADSPLFFEVDASSVLAAARPFFPREAFAKVTRLLACLAQPAVPPSQPCNLDDRRMERDPAAPASAPLVAAAPTSLRLEPAHVSITLPRNAVGALEIVRDGLSESFVDVDGQIDPLWLAVQRVMGASAPGLQLAVSAGAPLLADGREDPSRVTFHVEFRGYLGDLPTFVAVVPEAEVQVRPWRVVVETHRRGPPAATDLPVVRWPRLQRWLNEFSQLPWGVVPQGPDSGLGVCPPCVPALSAVTESKELRELLAKSLPTLLDPVDVLTTATRLDADGFYRATWTDELHQLAVAAGRPEVLAPFVSALTCVSTHRCAVGFSRASDDKPFMPTTVGIAAYAEIEATSSFRVELLAAPGDGVKLVTPVDFAHFFNANQLRLRLEVLTATASKLRYRLSAPVAGDLDALRIFADESKTAINLGASVAPPGKQVWFETAKPSLPSWTLLRRWLTPAQAPGPDGGGSATNSTSGGGTSGGSGDGSKPSEPDTALCYSCLPSVQACMSDTPCWNSVQDMLLPRLQLRVDDPSTTTVLMPLNTKPLEGGARMLYSYDLTPTVAIEIAMSPAMLGSPQSMALLVEPLACLARVGCDLEYLTAAATPPATAHIPTSLRYADVQFELALYRDARIAISMPGRPPADWMQPGEVGSEALTQFLQQALVQHSPDQQSDVPMPFRVDSYRFDDVTKQHLYHVTLVNYVGSDVQLELTAEGERPMPESPQAVAQTLPATVAIEAVDQLPEWPRLRDIFSLTNPQDPALQSRGDAPNTLGFSCRECHQSLADCYADAACQLALTTGVVPVLQGMRTHDSLDGVFRFDPTAELQTRVLPMLQGNAEAGARLLRVFACSALSACAMQSSTVLTPFDTATLAFDHATSVLQLALGLPAEVRLSTAPDAVVPWTSDVQQFEQALAGVVLPPFSVRVAMNGVQQTPTVDVVELRVSMVGFYGQQPPHFSWAYKTPDGVAVPNAPPPGESEDAPWHLVFKSTSYFIKNSFLPYVQWLSNNPLV